jgi:Nuclease A inhibitor-like protein
MTNETSESNTPETPPTLQQQVDALLPELYYPSESDEPIAFVTCYLKEEEPLTVSQIKNWLMLPPSVYVEERSEAEFWEPVTQEEDWFGEEERQRMEQFRTLKCTLEENLTVRQFFRVGDTEIDVYVLGRTPEGVRAGIQTKVVET